MTVSSGNTYGETESPKSSVNELEGRAVDVISKDDSSRSGFCDFIGRGKGLGRWLTKEEHWQ